MSPDHDTLANMLLRARSGDQDAAARFADRSSDIVRRAARRRLRRQVRPIYDDGDVSQMVLLDLFTQEFSTDVFRSPGRMPRFLLAVARNKIRQLHRQELGTRKRCRDRAVPLEDDIHDRGLLPDVMAAVEDEWRDLLRRLPPFWGQVIALLREGHTRDEVARLMRVSLSTIDRVVRGARDVVLGHRSG